MTLTREEQLDSNVGLRTRQVTRRIVVQAILRLETPTILSNGDIDPSVDIPIQMDSVEPQRALLSGSSLAGAMRNFLNDYELGYRTLIDKENLEGTLARALFGGTKGDDDGAQSPLIVEDALSIGPVRFELRDGVAIDPQTNVAVDQAKYDMQALAADTEFKIGVELVINKENKMQLEALRLVLCALEVGQIRLGSKKHRGFGQVTVSNWQVWSYDLTTTDGLLSWLAHDSEHEGLTNSAAQSPAVVFEDWGNALKCSVPDARNALTIVANFDVRDSLLIRSGFEQMYGPDAAHLVSKRNGKPTPVIPGTSLAGILRSQALRIANTVTKSDQNTTINQLFGYMAKPEESVPSYASRVIVNEVSINGATDLVQSRVKIDRFTGGAFDSALFTEQPVFGGQFEATIQVLSPEPAEIGLMLLALKDLWTGMRAVGGGNNVGRGRLQGLAATINWIDADGQPQKAQLDAAGNVTGNLAMLNSFVAAVAQIGPPKEATA